MFQALIEWLDRLGPRLYAAFLEGDRWQLYLKGLLTTLELTVVALVVGTILGVLVAAVRTAHDQQRLGQRNVFLGILNGICKFYTTVIRGTPMLVQILIWGFVVFASSRNKFMVGVVARGIKMCIRDSYWLVCTMKKTCILCSAAV